MEVTLCFALFAISLVHGAALTKLSCYQDERCTCPDHCTYANGDVNCTGLQANCDTCDICIIRICQDSVCDYGRCPLNYCLNGAHCSACNVSDGRTISFTTSTPAPDTTQYVYNKPVEGPSKVLVEGSIGAAFGVFILIIVAFVIVYFHRDKCCGSKTPKDKYTVRPPKRGDTEQTTPI